jgi:hypothetical protein
LTDKTAARAVEKAFGAESRRHMLEEYVAAAEAITPANAWHHVYKLLLWIDRTTGLAHCYESDKSQPGRPWYGRSLAFHDWISQQLEVKPAQLAKEIDWLFIRGTEKLARFLVVQQAERARRAEEQRAPYAGRGFPQPGEDAELEALLKKELSPWLAKEPPAEAMRDLAQRLRSYLGQENKRKNLVGEGFEDVLAFLIAKLPAAMKLKIDVRQLLHAVPGFGEPPRNEKPKKVDVAIIGSNRRRHLVSAKWSVRADREEQFSSDFDAYVRLEKDGEDFEYVLITNEFDPARLKAACEKRKLNAHMFSAVVHVNPEGVLAAYGSDLRESAKAVAKYINTGRLMSLEAWLSKLK